MDTLITAIVTACATIIAAAIVYNVKIAKIKDNVQEILAKSGKIAETIMPLPKEHSEINLKINDVFNVTTKINTLIEKEETVSKFQYENLNEKQKEIKESIFKLYEFEKEFEKINVLNISLQKENLILERENERLNKEIERLHLHESEHDCDYRER